METIGLYMGAPGRSIRDGITATIQEMVFLSSPEGMMAVRPTSRRALANVILTHNVHQDLNVSNGKMVKPSQDVWVPVAAAIGITATIQGNTTRLQQHQYFTERLQQANVRCTTWPTLLREIGAVA